jgi:ADP-heptose:LPS heptosyltransferase
MKILIYSFNDKIGDGLQKVSFLQEIKRIYPDSHITYTTTNTTTLKDKLNPLVQDCIDEFIENNCITSSLKNLFKENKIFKNKYFDLIIDLQKVVIRTICLKKISHGKFFSPAAGLIFSDFKNVDNIKFKNLYIEKFYFNILTVISKKNYPKIPEIKLPNIQKAKDLIHTIENHNIGIAPGAGDPIRCWDFDNYLLVAKLLKKKGYNIYFFLGPNEKQFLKKCEAEGFVCPEWSNGELISREIVFTMNLAKKMSLLLCNDGGTAWMFEFVGIHTFKIFGVSNERKFARPNFSTTIQVKDYGFDTLQSFPVELYKMLLTKFLKKNFNSV